VALPPRYLPAPKGKKDATQEFCLFPFHHCSNVGLFPTVKVEYSGAPPPKLLLPAATTNRGNDFGDFCIVPGQYFVAPRDGCRSNEMKKLLVIPYRRLRFCGVLAMALNLRMDVTSGR
jgi:hypothetical protein